MAAPAPAAPCGGSCAGKKALITGASRGIGRAIAVALAAENAEVILTARSVEQLEETAKLCTTRGASRTHIMPADCCSPEAVDAMARAVLDAYGYIDILVCNAGCATRDVSKLPADQIWESENPLTGDPDAWGKVLSLNLEAPMRLTRAFAPAMAEKKEGVIVHIASIAGIDAYARAPVYCASKWGLRGWSKSCYQALRPHGIKVSCICPGLVDTSMTAWHGGDRSMFIQPEDIAQACVLVCRMSVNAVPEEIVVRTCVPVEGT